MSGLYKKKKRNIIITFAVGLACWLFAAAHFSEIGRLGRLAVKYRPLVAEAAASGSSQLQTDAAALVKDIDSRTKNARVTGSALALAGLLLVGSGGLDALRLKKLAAKQDQR